MKDRASPSPGPVNMHRIAEELGLSVATISRALQRPEMVKRETRERILSRIEDLGYVSNAGARDLIRQASSIIGVIVPSMEHEAFATTMHAIQSAAMQRDLSVLTGVTAHDPKALRAILRKFMERRVAGVALIGLDRELREEVRTLAARGTPCVVLWELLNLPPLRCVGFDNKAAARRAIDYLLELGHRQIAVMTGPLTAQRVRDRVEGVRAALRKAGIDFPPHHLVSSEPTLDAGRSAMLGLMRLEPRPTAVFAASDQMALGAMAAARQMGLSVPRDVSVCGFDDISVAAYAWPPLTTVRVPAENMGRYALEVMMRADPDGKAPTRLDLGSELVIRDSCSPPRGA